MVQGPEVGNIHPLHIYKWSQGMKKLWEPESSQVSQSTWLESEMRSESADDT